MTPDPELLDEEYHENLEKVFVEKFGIEELIKLRRATDGGWCVPFPNYLEASQ